MSKELDEILETGTEEEVEAAMAEMELSGDVLFGEAEDDEVIVEVPEQKNDVVEPVEEPKEEPTDNPALESSPEDKATETGVIEKDGKFFVEVSKDNAEIESKDGKHKIPYGLLEGSRGEAAELKTQLAEQTRVAQELQASLDESKRVSELHSKQLEEAGIDPKLLPEQMLNDPKLMERIKEDYPEIGELVSTLAQQIKAAPSQQVVEQPQTPVKDEPTAADEAFNNSENLQSWMKEGGDRWETAKFIDNQLANDPSFDNKTPQERFAEVEKRVMNVFGDEVKAESPTETPTQVVTAPTKQPLIPNTPTDLGQQTNDLGYGAHILEQDAGAMAASMQDMSEDKIEELLEGVSNFL